MPQVAAHAAHDRPGSDACSAYCREFVQGPSGADEQEQPSEAIALPVSGDQSTHEREGGKRGGDNQHVAWTWPRQPDAGRD